MDTHQSRAISVQCWVAVAALIVGGGCMSTRSISDSGYSRWGGNDLYQGEISEFSLIGVDPAQPITDEEITRQFQERADFAVAEGSAVMLVQSGALFPDEPMQTAMAAHYRIAPFSGLVSKEQSQTNMARAFRLAAARGGMDYFACYWGVLEAEQYDLATKTVSWVPIVGRAVPDETQEMRIRLKLVLVDVRTGQWAMLVPDPVSSRSISGRIRREQADQQQVAQLKQAGYAALAEAFVEEFSN